MPLREGVLKYNTIFAHYKEYSANNGYTEA